MVSNRSSPHHPDGSASLATGVMVTDAVADENGELHQHAVTDAADSPALPLTGRLGRDDEPAIHVEGGGDKVRPLHFYSPPPNGDKPAFIVTEANGVGQKNYPCASHRVLIRDVRAHPSREQFRLSVESFALCRGLAIPPDVDISNDEQVKEVFTKVAEDLIKSLIPGVQKIFVFDKTLRRASATQGLNRPVRKVHVDQSARAALLRAEQYLPKELADQVLQGKLRLRIINVWRPLLGPITDHPLCLAESPSVPEEDLAEIAHIYHNHKGETYHCRYRGETAHRFWYLSSMETTDSWLIQCFDSVRDAQGRRRRCVHAAFEMADSGDGDGDNDGGRLGVSQEGKRRESIEVRCLVLGGEES